MVPRARPVRPARPSPLALVVVAALGCGGGDEAFVDAPPRDGREIDGGTDAPQVTFPSSFALGDGNCGASASATFDAANVGGGDLTYAIASSSDLVTVIPAEGTILAGTTTTFTVSAAIPADATPGATVAADLTITSPQLAAPVVIPVTAEPRGAVITLTPPAAGFGDVVVGETATRTILVANAGNAPASIAFAAPPDDGFAAAFRAGTLAAGASREAIASYTPAELGAASSASAITITGAVCGDRPTSLPMTASGIPVGAVAVTGNLAFGTVTCGAAAATATVTITNHGSGAATWSAAFLADPEGDHARYEISPASGSLPPGGSTTATVTRLAIPLPAAPRAYDATLRVTTTEASAGTRDHDLPVTQALSGPVLAVGPTTFDFGFAPAGEVLTRSITVTNAGTAPATATFTASGARFSVTSSGATIASGGGTAAFGASYAGQAGTWTGSVTVSAPGACSGPVTVALDAGQGPWTTWMVVPELGGPCHAPTPGASIDVHNPGTQPLVLSGCSEATTTDIAPTFTPPTLAVGPGSAIEQLAIGWQPPSPLRSGTVTTTITCATNEKFHTERSFQLTRTMTGADLELTLLDGPLSFTCGQPDATRRIRVHNVGNDASGFLIVDYYLVSPLWFSGSSASLGAGSAMTYAVDYAPGSGSDSWCDWGSGSSFQGYAGIYTGSAADNLCSVTPDETLEVYLFR